jgi:hypothetical protein
MGAVVELEQAVSAARASAMRAERIMALRVEPERVVRWRMSHDD